MLVFGTQMYLVTFIFVSIELVILFYLTIHRLARPDDNAANLNIALISLLLIYNITGGLLPDPKLPGSFFIQEVIAYFTGFITPCYFPYYVYHAFGLKQLKFHVYKGVYLFLVLPYVIFVSVFAITGNLREAEHLLVLPVLYATWVIISLIKAMIKKYRPDPSSKESKAEITVLMLSITPWIGLPVVTYFDMGQRVEALITNLGFLLLFGLQVKHNVQLTRTEHQKLLESERQLQCWNRDLREEVKIRTAQLERANEQRVNNFINLVHEVKTPLTLVKNYLDDYAGSHQDSEELSIIQAGVGKLIADVANLFDLERFIKGIHVYNHYEVSDFSHILKQNMVFFEHYSSKKEVTCEKDIDDHIFVKADHNAVNRIINNIIENAIKFSTDGGVIKVTLRGTEDKILFIVEDDGIGIDLEGQGKIFEPYFQIGHKTTSLQGMGLGLPIVKKILDKLKADITIRSNPALSPGTKITISLDRYKARASDDTLHRESVRLNSTMYDLLDYHINEAPFDKHKKSVFLVEDSKAMQHFLSVKLTEDYNFFHALNGVEALSKLHSLPAVPDVILLDVMMDKMDGFHFAKIISNQVRYNHIPVIFLTARSTVGDRLKGLQLGAIDYIAKPFLFELLKYKIENILNTVERKYRLVVYNSFLNHDLSPDSGWSLAKGSSGFHQICRLHGLTKREMEITDLLRQGKSYKLIAESLYISEKTVGKHIEHIFEKMGASNKMELINKLLYTYNSEDSI